MKTIFKATKHPYTQALYNSIPSLTDSQKKRLEVISGMVPNPLEFPSGCRFNPRCKFSKSLCKREEPELVEISNNHKVRCFLYNREKIIT